MNVDKLREELEWLMAHPDKVRLSQWINAQKAVPPDMDGPTPELLEGDAWQCGTVACLAGWVAIHAGWKPALYNWGDDAEPRYEFIDGDVVPGTNPAASDRMVSRVAADVLELTDEQAVRLFYESSLLDVWRQASEMTNGEIEVPPRDKFDFLGHPMSLEVQAWREADKAAESVGGFGE